MDVVISGTGVYLPPNIISNKELVESFNSYAEFYNAKNQYPINQGTIEPMLFSSESFIIKSSRIQTRHAIDKEGILDINIMHPQFENYNSDDLSIQAQIGVEAAIKAMQSANKSPSDIDMVIASCSGYQRYYPSISIEIQNALGIGGFAFDMNVACSSISFALFNAFNAIKNRQAKTVLIVSPELFTAQTNFRDRNSHFLFGDAATALVIEDSDVCQYSSPYKIIDIRLSTLFSKNIINELGITTIYDNKIHLFAQEGAKVFKDVVSNASKLIKDHLNYLNISSPDIFWLHQANAVMNQLILKKALDRSPLPEEMPLPIEFCGNTSSCGVVIAYDMSHKNQVQGSIGALVTFGAGYSFGSIVLMKL